MADAGAGFLLCFVAALFIVVYWRVIVMICFALCFAVVFFSVMEFIAAVHAVAPS